MSITKLLAVALTILLAGFLQSCSADDADSAVAESSELQKITKIAIETCGSKEKVESVSEDGFTCF